jgi:hypothetical protein
MSMSRRKVTDGTRAIPIRAVLSERGRGSSGSVSSILTIAAVVVIASPELELEMVLVVGV